MYFPWVHVCSCETRPERASLSVCVGDGGIEMINVEHMAFSSDLSVWENRLGMLMSVTWHFITSHRTS